VPPGMSKPRRAAKRLDGQTKRIDRRMGGWIDGQTDRQMETDGQASFADTCMKMHSTVLLVFTCVAVSWLLQAMMQKEMEAAGQLATDGDAP
jgi:hypothetical protein